MLFMKIHRIGFALASAAAVVAGVVTLSSPASADTASIAPGRVQLCAQGNYSVHLDFSANDGGGLGIAENLLAPGQCQTYNIPFFDSNGTLIQAFGRFNTSSNEFFIPQAVVVDPRNMTIGLKLLCGGTTANGGADAHCNLTT